MYHLIHRLPHQAFPTPSRNEDMYALRTEIHERMIRARRLQKEREKAERAVLKRIHHNHCAECGSELERVQFREGAVRQCPTCRGVFMDEGMFARLTHPESEERSYLTGLFRGFLLDWTTGTIREGGQRASDRS